MGVYESAVLAASPVGYWRLNDTGTTAADDTGGGHAGTVLSGTTTGQTNLLVNETGASMQASLATSVGGVDVASWAGLDLTTALTLETVFRVPDLVNTEPLLRKNYAYLLRRDTAGHLYFRLNFGGVQYAVTTTATPSTGVPHHVAATWSLADRTMRVYVDGTVDATTTLTPAGMGNDTNPTEKLTFLYDIAGGYGNHLQQEAAVYGTALSAATVADHASKALTAVPSVTGTGGLALPKYTLAASGGTTAAVTGTGGLTPPKYALAASGAETFVATAGLSLARPTLAGVGGAQAQGTAVLALRAPVLAGAGTYTPTAITGTAALAPAVLVEQGSGQLSAPGVATLWLPGLVLHAGGLETLPALGGLILPDPTLDSAGMVGPPPEPIPAYDIERRLRRLVPWYYAPAATNRRLLRALLGEVALFRAALAATLQQASPETAALWALDAGWDMELGLAPDQTLDQARRQERALARLHDEAPVTLAAITRLIGVYERGDVLLHWDAPASRLSVTFVNTYGVPPGLADLKRALRAYLPAWIDVTYVIRYLTWAELAATGLTWAELTATGLTWARLVSTDPATLTTTTAQGIYDATRYGASRYDTATTAPDTYDAATYDAGVYDPTAGG